MYITKEYSRNGYYLHGVSGVAEPVAGAGSWHEPVSSHSSVARPDSPSQASYQAQANMYSCKLQGPPSPPETKVAQSHTVRIHKGEV